MPAERNLSTPAAKRRRLDSANETLRKPFKSPALLRGQDQSQDRGWKREPVPAAAAAVSANDGATLKGRVTVKTTSSPQAGGNGRLERRLGKPTPAPRPFSAPRPHRGVLSSPTRDGTMATISGCGGGGGRDFEPGKKASRQAFAAEQIRDDRVGGGRGGARHGTEEELGVLIGKWTAASRMAAEEVFEASRKRVLGMGGLKAWRRLRREEARRFAERMMDEELAGRCRVGASAGAGDGDGCWEGDYSRRSTPGEVGAEKDGDEDEGDGEDEVSEILVRFDAEERGEGWAALLTFFEDEFTMGTMLKSMNIDFDVIGYDEYTGWWRDG